MGIFEFNNIEQWWEGRDSRRNAMKFLQIAVRGHQLLAALKTESELMRGEFQE